jgi:flagellin
MSGIVLSASVRQNLLALQSTASLLAKTQNNLATGNKVNTALDNPTEFFTAQALNNRAGDIANLLDGIGNGVQVLQAANTGLTSLQQLVANAQSIANQVLQSPTGYTTKSNVSSAVVPGATAQNLLGNNTNATVTGTAVNNDNLSGAAAIPGATLLSGTAASGSNNLASGITAGDTLTVDGVTFTFVAGSVSAGTNIGIGDSVTHLLAAIDAVTGTTTA